MKFDITIKVIIPAAGKGKRLRPFTLTVPKPLLKVAGKRILEYILNEVVNIPQVDEVIFILGYMKEKIEEFVIKNYPQLNTKFVYQKKPAGLGEAIYLTREFANGSPVLIILGDTIMKMDYKKFILSEYSQIAVREVPDPERFGIVYPDKEGFITKMIEKPQNPESNLAITGVYYIKDSSILFEKLDYIIKNDIRTKGEFQVTDALQLMIESGYKIKAFPVENWFDCGNIQTTLETNKTFILENPYKPEIKGSIISNRVFISDNSIIKNSIIGDFVFID